MPQNHPARSRFVSRWTVSLVIGLTTAITPSLGAATYEVDTTLDSADPAFGQCLPNTVDCSLRGAITAANNHGGPDVVILPFGIYSLGVGGAGEDDNLGGDLDVTGELVIEGPGGVIDGGGIDRVFDLHGGELELRHLLIHGGYLAGQAAGGGALRNSGGVLTLHNVTVQGNESAQGGAIFQDGGHLAVVEGSTLRENTARDSGGAIHIAGGTATITASALEANRADGHGGGVAFYGETLAIEDSVLEANVTTSAWDGDGGAVYADAGSVKITDSELRLNVAEYPGAYFGRGGAIALGSDASLDVVASELADNVSGYHGGALYAEGSVQMTDVEVAGNSAASCGGGAAFSGGSAVLTRTTLTGNAADTGGAIYSEAMVFIDEGTLTDNEAVHGGAIYNDGGSARPADLTVLGSVLVGNWAETAGGAIFNKGGLATAVLFDCEVSDNESSAGAGLANAGDASGGPYLEVRSCDISGNRAIDFAGSGFGGNGGGIWNIHAGAFIYATEVVGNSADHEGGGIVSSGGVNLGLLVFNRSLAAGNIAGGNGGGLWVAGAGSAVVESRAVVNNSTISGNVAAALGGGLYVYEETLNPAPARAYLYNATVADNQGLGGPGDGLFAGSGSDIFVQNSIVATAGQPDCAWSFGGAIHSRGHNIESGLACAFTGPGDQRNTAPLLDPLANYGGATRTRRLRSTSPAFEAGDPNGCDADRDGDGVTDAVPLGGDQRGVTRTNICDVGAYERPPAL